MAGYALIVDGDPQDLDGAVAELSHSGDEVGVVRAEIRIPAPTHAVTHMSDLSE